MGGFATPTPTPTPQPGVPPVSATPRAQPLPALGPTTNELRRQEEQRRRARQLDPTADLGLRQLSGRGGAAPAGSAPSGLPNVSGGAAKLVADALGIDEFEAAALLAENDPVALKVVNDFLAGGAGGGGGGGGGPTAAELALQEREVANRERQTRLQAIVGELENRIRQGELGQRQAETEFEAQIAALSRQAEVFSQANEQFLQAAQFAVPAGTEFIPGFEPEGIAGRLVGGGFQGVRANAQPFNPFGAVGLASQAVARANEDVDFDSDRLDQALQGAYQEIINAGRG